MTTLKYGKIWHMANKRKKLEINHPKIRNKISKITLIQLKHLYIPRRINQRKSNSNHKSLSVLNQVKLKNWYIHIALKTQDNLKLKTIGLLESDAYRNYIREILIPLIPSKYYEETKEQLLNINRNPLQIKYKLSKAYLCYNEYCF